MPSTERNDGIAKMRQRNQPRAAPAPRHPRSESATTAQAPPEPPPVPTEPAAPPPPPAPAEGAKPARAGAEQAAGGTEPARASQTPTASSGGGSRVNVHELRKKLTDAALSWAVAVRKADARYGRLADAVAQARAAGAPESVITTALDEAEWRADGHPVPRELREQ